jgi:hypothetical protein
MDGERLADVCVCLFSVGRVVVCLRSVLRGVGI